MANDREERIRQAFSIGLNDSKDALSTKRIMEDVERAVYYGMQARVGLTELDKMKLALTKLFIPNFNSEGVPAFAGIRDAYANMTGDDEVRGIFDPRKVSSGLRSCQDFDAGSFSKALLNAVNVYLSKSYRDIPFREDSLISEIRGVTNFRSIDTVQLGYFKDLDEVDPEAADYQSMSSFTDTAAQYGVSTRGGILWISRKLFINDAIEVIKSMVLRMARSARRTHARYVWKFYTYNANCADGTPWFSAGHGNVGSDAIDVAPLVAAITALANMTEAGSGEKVGFDLASFKWNLVVPISLWDSAVAKNKVYSYYSANDLTTKIPNPCRDLFGDHNERVITCPFDTTAGNWGVIRDKEDVPIIEMSYMNGKREPEFIIEVGPNPLSGQMFTSEKWGYKIRHEYGGALIDYRSGFKAIVS